MFFWCIGFFVIVLIFFWIDFNIVILKKYICVVWMFMCEIEIDNMFDNKKIIFVCLFYKVINE